MTIADGALTHEYALSFTIGSADNPIRVSGPGGVEHFASVEDVAEWLEDELYEREGDFWDEVGMGAALDTPESYDIGREPFEVAIYMLDGGRHSVSHSDPEKCAQALEALASLGSVMSVNVESPEGDFYTLGDAARAIAFLRRGETAKTLEITPIRSVAKPRHLEGVFLLLSFSGL
ncbi:hypothetical protein FHS00_001327 [Limimaricola variabilis]|uniref:Uncharacterized protein n=1 Tax=Limimaricola variabilis TaxID=1492771 RepID=A0ABR6HMH9_9RHOB|nr:hypothetical protein [Limimaricola variabilis]MBB3711756.1 hypothetical protein [Limimaricola variabilis]